MPPAKALVRKPSGTAAATARIEAKASSGASRNGQVPAEFSRSLPRSLSRS